ncbi:MAG: DUF4157 domain-containing protein [Cyanobacteria bacterium P01_A01_bin.123]
MVYQRKKRAYEQEPLHVPQPQPSLFASPDLETEEVDNPYVAPEPTAAPNWEAVQRQIDNPTFDFGKISILPPDSAVQRQPVDPSTLSKQERFRQKVFSVQRDAETLSGPLPQPLMPVAPIQRDAEASRVQTGAMSPLSQEMSASHQRDQAASPLSMAQPLLQLRPLSMQLPIQRDVLAGENAMPQPAGSAGEQSVDLKPKGSGSPLPKQVSDPFVQSGYPEVKQARVHVDDAATQSIQAKAYTQKHNIVVQSSGANDPKLLGHEATHVVQQSQMALKPDVNGTPINANPALEQNADDNGERVVRNEPVSVVGVNMQQPTVGGGGANVMQRKEPNQRTEPIVNPKEKDLTRLKEQQVKDLLHSRYRLPKADVETFMTKWWGGKESLEGVWTLKAVYLAAKKIIKPQAAGGNNNFEQDGGDQNPQQDVQGGQVASDQKTLEYRELYKKFESSKEYFEIHNSEIPDYFKAIYALKPDPAYLNMTPEKLVTHGNNSYPNLIDKKPRYWASGFDNINSKATSSGRLHARNSPGYLIPAIFPENVPNTVDGPLFRGDSRSPWDPSLKTGFKVRAYGNLNRFSDNILRHVQPTLSPYDSAYISTARSKEVAVRFAETGGSVYEFKDQLGISVDTYVSTTYKEEEHAILNHIPLSAIESVSIIGTDKNSPGSWIENLHKLNAWDSPVRDTWEKVIPEEERGNMGLTDPDIIGDSSYTWKKFYLGEKAINKDKLFKEVQSEENLKELEEKTDSRIKSDEKKSDKKWELIESMGNNLSMTNEEFVEFLTSTKVIKRSYASFIRELQEQIESGRENPREYTNTGLSNCVIALLRKNHTDGIIVNGQSIKISSVDIIGLKDSEIRKAWRRIFNPFFANWWKSLSSQERGKFSQID